MVEIKYHAAVKLLTDYWRVMGLPVGEHFDRTPSRIVEMHLEAFAAVFEEEPPFRFTVFENDRGIDQLVIQRGIKFSSWCGHHLVPFFGVAHIGYLPDKKLCGLSKLARAVKWLSKKPTTQEDLVEDVADYLQEKLDPQALFVTLVARHTCIACRGVEAVESDTLTSVCRGPLGLKPELKSEFMDFINH